MGKSLDWVIEDRKSGRLSYRRTYPADVRAALGIWDKKVTLGAKRIMTESAFRIYHRACADFVRDVNRARAASRVAARKTEASFDRLSAEQIDYLGALMVHDRRTGMDQRVRQGHARSLGEIWGQVLPAIREARVSGDLGLLEEIFGPTADDLLATEGLRLDPADTEGRAGLIWELSTRIVAEGNNFAQAAEGFAPPIPLKPERLTNSKGRTRTVSALLDAYKAAKWDGWSPSSRSAIQPVFRFLRETIGDRDVTSIDRDEARSLFELLKRLPANLGKKKGLAGLPIPLAIDEATRLGMTPIGPKTINSAYMAHISAIFAFAVDEDWAHKNFFVKLTASDPVDPEDKRDPFTDEHLKLLFQSSPWDRRCPDASEEAGRYWVPIIGLFMGARLAEISGLRIIDATEIEGTPALMIKKVAGGRGIKNKESRRRLPIHSHLLRMGLLTYIEHRRETAGPEDLLFPEGEPNGRGQYGVKIGKWFGRLVAKRNIEGTMVSFHSLRHNWEDRLKVAGIHGTPVGQALGGRKQTGSEGIYGSRGWPIDVLREAMEKVAYPRLDLSHLVAEDSG